MEKRLQVFKVIEADLYNDSLIMVFEQEQELDFQKFRLGVFLNLKLFACFITPLVKQRRKLLLHNPAILSIFYPILRIAFSLQVLLIISVLFVSLFVLSFHLTSSRISFSSLQDSSLQFLIVLVFLFVPKEPELI